MQKELNTKQELALWQRAEARLDLLNLESIPTQEEINELLTKLPIYNTDEPLSKWTKACQNYLEKQVDNKVVPFKAWAKLPALTSITRLAADSGQNDYPLPGPGRIFDSNDGRFSLSIEAAPNKQIHIKLWTLGFAVDEFANQHLGISSAFNPEYVLVDFKLDEDGDGEAYLEDTVENRKALQCPLIVLIDLLRG